MKHSTRPSTASHRSFHLIDAENLVGGAMVRTETARRLWHIYTTSLPATSTDQFVLGSSRLFLRHAMPAFATSGIRIVCQDGRDGADRALLASVDLDHLAARFTRLVIASGDHSFAELASAARERGLHVSLVLGVGGCSRRLREAAHTRTQIRPQLLRSTAASTWVAAA